MYIYTNNNKFKVSKIFSISNKMLFFWICIFFKAAQLFWALKKQKKTMPLKFLAQFWAVYYAM